MGILSDFLGGSLGTKIAEIVGNRLEDKSKVELATLEITKAIADRAHELEMASLAADQQADTEQQETIRAELGQTDEYTKRTRPMLVRRAWWASVIYVGASALTQTAGLLLHIQPYSVDWSILTILMAPVLTYFGVRSFDKWKLGK